MNKNSFAVWLLLALSFMHCAFAESVVHRETLRGSPIFFSPAGAYLGTVHGVNLLNGQLITFTFRPTALGEDDGVMQSPRLPGSLLQMTVRCADMRAISCKSVYDTLAQATVNAETVYFVIQTNLSKTISYIRVLNIVS